MGKSIKYRTLLGENIGFTWQIAEFLKHLLEFFSENLLEFFGPLWTNVCFVYNSSPNVNRLENTSRLGNASWGSQRFDFIWFYLSKSMFLPAFQFVFDFFISGLSTEGLSSKLNL